MDSMSSLVCPEKKNTSKTQIKESNAFEGGLEVARSSVPPIHV